MAAEKDERRGYYGSRWFAQRRQVGGEKRIEFIILFLGNPIKQIDMTAVQKRITDELPLFLFSSILPDIKR